MPVEEKEDDLMPQFRFKVTVQKKDSGQPFVAEGEGKSKQLAKTDTATNMLHLLVDANYTTYQDLDENVVLSMLEIGSHSVLHLNEFCSPWGLHVLVYHDHSSRKNTAGPFRIEVVVGNVREEGYSERSKKGAKKLASSNMYNRSENISQEEWDELCRSETPPSDDQAVNLHVFCEWNGFPAPEYATIGNSGPAPAPVHTMQVTVGSHSITETATSTKKCKNMLNKQMVELLKNTSQHAWDAY